MDFDNNLWELKYNSFGEECLIYKGPKDKPVSLHCSKSMHPYFKGQFKKGFSLQEFDTSELTDFSYMFFGCTLPEGFSLGTSFNTESATCMDHMFYMCRFNEDFAFPEGFSTDSVRSLRYMFAHSRFSNKLQLPNEFSQALDVTGVFSNTVISPDNLASTIIAPKAQFASRMFERCSVNGDFTLGLDLKNVMDASHLFEMTQFSNDPIMPASLDFRKAKTLNNLLTGCNKVKEISKKLLLPPEITVEQLYEHDKTE